MRIIKGLNGWVMAKVISIPMTFPNILSRRTISARKRITINQRNKAPKKRSKNVWRNGRRNQELQKQKKRSPLRGRERERRRPDGTPGPDIPDLASLGRFHVINTLLELGVEAPAEKRF